MHIEPMTDSHADAVLAIYQAGIGEGRRRVCAGVAEHSVYAS